MDYSGTESKTEGLLLYFDVLPEGNIITKVFTGAVFDNLDGARQRLWITPGVIFAELVALANVKVLTLAFPRADIWGVTFMKKFLLDTTWREVPVPFDINKLVFVSFGYYSVVPNCFHTYYYTPIRVRGCVCGSARSNEPSRATMYDGRFLGVRRGPCSAL